MPSPALPCPACGFVVFRGSYGSLERCPVCGWVDDLLQLAQPDFVVGGNPGLSLRQAQRDALLAFPLETLAIRVFARHPAWRPLFPAEHPRAGGITPASPVCYLTAPDPDAFEPYWLVSPGAAPPDE
jgi:hypothetical protein